jgi:hypothetical protein
MEFEDFRQVWQTQDNHPQYTINEGALRDIILKKKRRANRVTHISEGLLILVYTCAGALIAGLNFFKPPHFVFMYLLAAWTLATASVLMMGRIRRIRQSRRFDRSIHGDLDHGISTAAYQVRLSRLMRWNMVPIGIIILLGIREGNKPLWIGVCTLLFFVFAYYTGGVEHKIYEDRRKDFYLLKEKLEDK